MSMSTLIVGRCVKRVGQSQIFPKSLRRPIHTISTINRAALLLNNVLTPQIIISSSNNKNKKKVNTSTKMGSEAVVANSPKRKPRVLCLHGFRTSGNIFKTQMGKWPQFVRDQIDFIFPDAPFPCNGKSAVEGFFDPPYYEWFQSNQFICCEPIWLKGNSPAAVFSGYDYVYPVTATRSMEFNEYYNFDECLAYIEDCMIKNGPIDGLMGFSQGSIIAAALPGLQAQGMALTKVPKIKFLIIISGAKMKCAALAEKAYASPIEIPSVHFLGENDFLKPHGTVLLELFVDPVVIHHPKGHTIPRLDEKGLETLLGFIERMQKEVTRHEEEQEKAP